MGFVNLLIRLILLSVLLTLVANLSQKDFQDYFFDSYFFDLRRFEKVFARELNRLLQVRHTIGTIADIKHSVTTGSGLTDEEMT